MSEEPSASPKLVIGVLLHDFQLGGTERVAIRLANAWCRMGCRVLLFTGNDTGPQQELLGNEVEVFVATPPVTRERRRSPARLGQWVAACAELVDVYYLPGNSYFTAIDSLSRSGAGIYTTITNPLWRDDRSFIRNVIFALLTRRRLQKTAGVISMSPALFRKDRQLLGSKITMTMLPNAIFDAFPVKGSFAHRPWHICAVCRLVPQKNIALLLRSMALLLDLPVTLSIVGEGGLEADLRRLASNLCLDGRVQFLGQVPDAMPYLAEAEVMLLTSDYEGFPAVVAEALATGTFVVTSNCSAGLADILTTPKLGTIVREQTPHAFAKALRNFFSGSNRANMAERCAIARPLLHSHAVDIVARRHLQFMSHDRR